MEKLTHLDDMNIFSLLDAVEKRHRFYLHEKSLKELDSFLAGFDCACSVTEQERESIKQLNGLNDWVARQLGFAESTSGWCNMILERAGSDEKGFDLFFELVDKYRQETSER
jgi:hypothetical protein